MWVSPETIAAGTGSAMLGLAGWQVLETTLESFRQSRRVARFRRGQFEATEAMVEQARQASVLTQARAARERAGWREMVIAEIVDESIDCRSFYLVDPTGVSLPDFLPGQHLVVQCPADVHGKRPLRCYSLSDSPDPRYWRLTIKRVEMKGDEDRTARGLSDYLHGNFQVGDKLLIKGPQGEFFVDTHFDGPLVVLAAGIGITPAISMLRWSLLNVPGRPVWLFYQVRDGQQHPFARDLQKWNKACKELNTRTFYSRPTAHDRIGQDYDETGRFSAEHILREGLGSESKYYLCGPNEWMLSLVDGLKNGGVCEENIDWESFGGGDGPTNNKPKKGHAAKGKGNGPKVAPVPVRFAASKSEAMWDGSSDNLLDFAKQNQVEVPSGCRSGVCGSCAIKKLAGKVKYSTPPTCTPGEDEVLACIAQPDGAIELDI